jgi:hypothetical protein
MKAARWRSFPADILTFQTDFFSKILLLKLPMTDFHAVLQIPELMLKHFELPVLESQAQVLRVVQVLLHLGRPGRIGIPGKLLGKVQVLLHRGLLGKCYQS